MGGEVDSREVAQSPSLLSVPIATTVTVTGTLLPFCTLTLSFQNSLLSRSEGCFSCVVIFS